MLCREIVMQVFWWVIGCGQKVEKPVDLVRPSTIAKFESRDRALTSVVIALMYQYVERAGTTPSIRVAAKLLLCQSASKRAPYRRPKRVPLRIFTRHGTHLNFGHGYAVSSVTCCLSENGFAVAKTPCCLRIM